MTVHWKDLNKSGRIEAIQSAWRPGSTALQLGEALGISREAVCGMYHRYPEMLNGTPLGGGKGGRKSGRTGRKWTDEGKAFVARMMADHKSADAIALAMGDGVTGDQVIALVRRTPELKAIGWSARSSKKMSKEEREERKKASRRKWWRENRSKAARPTGEMTALPARKPFKPVVVSNNVSLMVQDFIAKNGVRRFEQNTRADYHSVAQYLADRGYRFIQRAARYTLASASGRPRFVTWREAIALVDKLRRAEGLEPFMAA